MANPPKAQGTAWETEFVRRCQDAGLVADRLAEGGANDPGDVWIGDTPGKATPEVPVVAWKRLTGNQKRRTPDGERDVVIMRTDDFLDMAESYYRLRGVAFVVECKARQNLNVTRTLYKTRQKLDNWKARR